MEKKSTYLLILFFLVGILSETSAKISPNESIFQLQFNKSLFISGEKIWFKNSLVSSHENDHQNILFVDLCGEGTIISSRILVRENNHWQGDIDIPDSLETGIYLFRAYIGNNDGTAEMVSELVTVINRFGNNQTNQLRKADLRNRPLDQINQLPSATGQILKTYTNSTVYKTKEMVECWIEKEKAELPSGISFSVYKIPEGKIEQPVSMDQGLNQGLDESLDENANDGNKKIYNRLTLSGEVIGKKSKTPISGEMVLLSIPDSIPQINYATTNENGEFRFDMDDYYGLQDVIVQTLSKSEEFNIVLFSNFLNPPLKIPFYLSDDVENCEFVKQAVQRAQLQKAYDTEIRNIKSEPMYKYPFYGTTASVVIPDDYVELNDFEEITKELLPLCKIRKEKGNYFLKIYDQLNFGVFDSPWILLDGVPIFNVEKLFPLNSQKIKKIETQPQIRCYGDLLIESVLSVITSNGNFEDVTLPVNAVRSNFETFYQPGEYKGNHFVGDVNIADFKDVLYWKPMLEPFSNVSKINFQCSYEKGSYIVVVQTIDQDGVIQRSVCYFSVE
jgi:hypothetical protein